MLHIKLDQIMHWKSSRSPSHLLKILWCSSKGLCFP
uniref:Uncharacterized protein n=1 Tax=Arundo donax TaxID=35708 RepID=A0A0A8ZFZ0_ARUDO